MAADNLISYPKSKSPPRINYQTFDESELSRKAEISRYWSEARYGGSPEGRLTNGTDDKPLSSWWISPLEGSSYHKEDLVYDDWW
jgi:hypothetical protein